MKYTMWIAVMLMSLNAFASDHAPLTLHCQRTDQWGSKDYIMHFEFYSEGVNKVHAVEWNEWAEPQPANVVKFPPKRMFADVTHKWESAVEYPGCSRTTYYWELTGDGGTISTTLISYYCSNTKAPADTVTFSNSSSKTYDLTCER